MASGYYPSLQAIKDVRALFADRAEQSAQIARMEEALKPMVRLYDAMRSNDETFFDVPNTEEIASVCDSKNNIDVHLTVGDLRRAALTKAGTP